MRHRARAGRDSGHSLAQQKTLFLSRKRKEFVDKMANTPSQIVADLYDASIEPSRWPHVLIALAERARADAVGLLFNDFATGRGHFEAAIGIPAEALASYRRMHSQSNVWLADEQPFRETNTAIRGSQIVGEEKVKSSSFYNEWLKPIGLLSHLFAVVERETDGVMLLMLARREGKPDFEDDIVGDIQTLVPAVEQALHAGRGVRRLRALENAALRAIDVMPIGVVMLDQNGAVIEANRSARAVLEAGEGLTVANGGLAVDIGGRQTQLRELITRSEKQAPAFASGELTLLPVRRQAGQRPLTLLLMPLEQTIEAHVKQAPVALLFIGDPERSVGFDQTRIARLYGLSRAESRVAALLASGYRLEQVAEALDIAYETVRKHLKQIFGKTGTYRQAELVRMLVTGPAGLSI
jgi:DNA-binding CsgD family transcriptional regulator/PAS domain-containing protein